jgi:hypothetical protein
VTTGVHDWSSHAFQTSLKPRCPGHASKLCLLTWNACVCLATLNEATHAFYVSTHSLGAQSQYNDLVLQHFGLCVCVNIVFAFLEWGFLSASFFFFLCLCPLFQVFLFLNIAQIRRIAFCSALCIPDTFLLIDIFIAPAPVPRPSFSLEALSWFIYLFIFISIMHPITRQSDCCKVPGLAEQLILLSEVSLISNRSQAH